MSRFVGPIKGISLGIYDGPHATPPDSDSGPVFLGIKNVTDGGRLDLSDVRHISEQDYPKWIRRVAPQKDDVVFSYEATLHRYALIPEDFRGCLGRRMALVRPDTSKVLPRFLHYYFLSNQWRAIVESNIINGATVDRIPIKRFPEFEVRIPDMRVQHRIASTLSAYDDLIENNRRRMALLEQAARLLYREWFVHLRFPGHEHVAVVDGVPVGWRSEPLRNLTTKIGSGATPRGGAAAYKTEGITLIRSQNVFDYSFDENGLAFIDENQAEKLANVIVEPNDILLNITGASVARCCIVPTRHLPARVNQHVMIIRTDTNVLGPHYLLHAINANQRKQLLLNIARAGGATREALTKDVVGNLEIPIPDPSILDMFEDFAEDVSYQIQTLDLAINRLAAARDLLLPRLMNGEIII